ncbi:cytochrome c3 family protein [Akkermansiaceae bacterium]|nr:cytochrome c3 family protein [Akkermansiaceae bacterium]
MKDKKPSSAFDRKDYARPNQDWVCGHLCKGEACRIGPSPKGKCRASFECVPLLDLKPGEGKGQFKCTRPASAGGRCDRGPMPDGSCCNAIPKCQPRRSLRNIRKRVIAFTVIATLLLLCIGIDHRTRDRFVNPGPISSPHASVHFSGLTKEKWGDPSNCAACHESARRNAGAWPGKIGEALSGGLSPHALIRKGPSAPTGMDKNCLACHTGKDFHQPNMAVEFACHTCHKEHGTSGFMPEVANSSCLDCHASAELMSKSREMVAGTDYHAFPSSAGKSAADNPSLRRPEGGYTKVIRDFHDGHPEFRVIRDKVRDVNTLKFNHKLHLSSGEIPELHGKALGCTDCHQTDAQGEYQLPITYEENCAGCHALQFDKDTPGLTLPHGDPFYVRSFLRSLSIQYEEYAKTTEGITSRDTLREYVQNRGRKVEKLYQTGAYMERAVFFADMKGEVPGGRRAPFAGCATCHDVSEPAVDNGAPVIAKVAAPNRWMNVGNFNHSMHVKGLSCLDCHNVMKSELTSDVNLPSIKSCVDCHSPGGGIDHRCITCHSYHNTPPGSLFGEGENKASGKGK